MTSAPPFQSTVSFYLLPIGDTGTGKTTLINSFANYSRYTTLDEAIENEPVVLADVGFTYSAAGVRAKTVYLKGSASGVNKEVVDVFGVTHTQDSSVYSIDSNDSEELIFYDNPGFGSQSLLKEEKIKKPIHAICIVLKPDETRLHTELRTFLKSEGKPLVKNIVYCFTNTRAHSFKPAATLTTLRDFLLDLEGTMGMEFPTKKENIFCFENGCFRYLCYLAANPGDQSRHHKVYAKEWTTNVEEYKRLSSHVKTLAPILHEEVKKPDIAMESTNFHDMKFISPESQEVQQASEIFMKTVDKSGEHASIRALKVKLVQLEVFNVTDDAKKEDTKDESITISDNAGLHIVVRQGDEELVQSLIDKGVDINGKDGEFNLSPLHVAAEEGHVDMVKLLLQHGATVDSEANNHLTPLHIAARHGHLLIVEMLIKAGASVSPKDKDVWTPLHFAAWHNRIESAKILLKHHASIDAATVFGRTPLHFVARNDHVDMVKLLFQHGAIVDSKDNEHFTPLQFAAQEGHDQVVNVLLGIGASVSSKDKDGWTPLHCAAKTNHVESARILLKNRAPILIVLLLLFIFMTCTLLLFVAQKGHVDMVKLLLEHGAIIESKGEDLSTSLHFAALQGHSLRVEMLIKAGASVSSKDKDGWTPLHFAAWHNRIESARILLKHHASIDAATVFGRTPLHFVARNGHVDMVKLLFQHGAIIDSGDNHLCTPLHLAAQNGNVDMVKLLFQHGAIVDSKDKEHITPLHLAAYGGHDQVVDVLLGAGASVSPKDKDAWTPLHSAAQNGNVDSVKLLLQNGAIIDSRHNDLYTPLHLAAYCGHDQVVDVLLRAGASVSPKDKDAWTPLHFAAWHNRLFVSLFLCLSDPLSKHTEASTEPILDAAFRFAATRLQQPVFVLFSL